MYVCVTVHTHMLPREHFLDMGICWQRDEPNPYNMLKHSFEVPLNARNVGEFNQPHHHHHLHLHLHLHLHHQHILIPGNLVKCNKLNTEHIINQTC